MQNGYFHSLNFKRIIFLLWKFKQFNFDQNTPTKSNESNPSGNMIPPARRRIFSIDLDREFTSSQNAVICTQIFGIY